MVQKRPKPEGWAEHIASIRQEFIDNTVAIYYLVIEHTPGWEGDGYDLGYPDKRVPVSPRFDTWGEAESWMEEHVPDPGKSLYIQKYRTVMRITYTDHPVKF